MVIRSQALQESTRTRRLRCGRRPFSKSLGHQQPPARLRDFLAVRLCGFDPELDGSFGILQGGLPRGAVGHAPRKFGHIHHVGVVFGAPPNDHLETVRFHLYACWPVNAFYLCGTLVTQTNGVKDLILGVRVPRFHLKMMRARNVVLAITSAIALAGLLAAVIWPAQAERCPVALSVARTEPSGIFDDAGVEMWMATLSISNSDARPGTPENGLYVKNSGRGIEAKVANRWIELEGGMACRLDRHGNATRMFLLPPGAEFCRVCLKYTDTSTSLKSRLWWPTRWLERLCHIQMPAKFWRWINEGQFRPSSHWREITTELPMPPKPAGS